MQTYRSKKCSFSRGLSLSSSASFRFVFLVKEGLSLFVALDLELLNAYSISFSSGRGLVERINPPNPVNVVSKRKGVDQILMLLRQAPEFGLRSRRDGSLDVPSRVDAEGNVVLVFQQVVFRLNCIQQERLRLDAYRVNQQKAKH